MLYYALVAPLTSFPHPPHPLNEAVYIVCKFIPCQVRLRLVTLNGEDMEVSRTDLWMTFIWICCDRPTVKSQFVSPDVLGDVLIKLFTILNVTYYQLYILDDRGIKFLTRAAPYSSFKADRKFNHYFFYREMPLELSQLYFLGCRWLNSSRIRSGFWKATEN